MSDFKNILRKVIGEVLINEIGESNLPPLPFSMISPFQYSFIISIDNDDVKVLVEFDKFIIGSTIWKLCFSPTLRNFETYYNVSYDVGGDNEQYSKTDMKILLKILSTITYIIKDFIINKNPDCLYIEGSEKMGENGVEQKNSIYGAYILKQLQNIDGYSSLLKGDAYNVYKKIN